MPKPAAKPARKPAPAVRLNSAQPEIVDPRWLLRMLGVVLVVALICGYLTLGLLFYLGSWQLELKPTHDAGKGSGLPTQSVTFGNFSGEPPMHGEWLPGDPNLGRDKYSVIYLRGADGQLDAGDATQIGTLHDHGLSVFAFDYRGYGPNAPRPHPTEQRMLQDAEAAWTYLVQTRQTSQDHVLVFGSGIGVSLAAQLLEQHNGAAGLIGYNADPEVLARIGRDPRGKLFPLRLLFHERFLLGALDHITVPKLLYSTGPMNSKRQEVYRAAADPKLTVEVPTHDAKEEQNALYRFLDLYIPRGIEVLQIPKQAQ